MQWWPNIKRATSGSHPSAEVAPNPNRGEDAFSPSADAENPSEK
jgi:hypothetical protein